ncbi:MAG: sensor domain-containing diguanylate cyclase, partial [Candidatus Dormibacteria bacterium]
LPGSFTAILLDDGNGVLRVAAGHGGPTDLAIPLPVDATQYSITETVVIEDLWNSPFLELLGVQIPEQMRGFSTAAAVPLHTQDHLLGVLVAVGAAGGRFDAGDLKVLEAIGPQLSAALENARMYEEMETLSLVDPLTRVGNRRAFDQRLAQELERAARNRTWVSLALLDIDHFKIYNDTHGHTAGDEILRRLGMAFSERLIRVSDVAYRYGGEEFAVILPDTDAAEAEKVMERVHEVLRSEPLPRAHSQPGGRLTISVGIGAFEGEAGTSAELVEQADLALYGAKQAGRDQTVVFNSELAATLTNWTTVLPTVIEQRALHAVYQPIVSLDERTVLAYEALGRPDGRDAVISVEGMFAAAQRLGSMPDLDWLCFRAAIQDAGNLPRGMELFVNITLAALMDANRDPEYLDLVLRWARRPATDIVLEISEREAINDIPRLARILQAHRDLGFRFALDDVGEGHSTFELLAAAEPEFVKIARSLVQDAANAGSAGTIRALVEFARATGAQIVAEGIEDEETAELVRHLGVNLGQGYALGRPGAMPHPAVDRGLAVG